jgi:hypothetical protein
MHAIRNRAPASATAAASVVNRGQAARSILIAATIVAVLDILYAILLYAVILGLSTPSRVFQSIAAGVLGKASFQGGTATVVLGGVLHFLIACIWTVIYFLLVRGLPSLRDRVRERSGAIVVGLMYGAFVHLMMNLVVIPLSQIHRMTDFDWDFWLNIVQQAVMVGLPIVLIVRDGERVPDGRS